MSSTMTLNPQIIGQAENAHRPILDRILARTGTSRHQWFALTITAANGGAIESDQLTARMTGALKIGEAEVAAAVAELTAARLMEATDGWALSLTGAGQARYRGIRGSVDEVVGRAYGDIPAEDLATAARVLQLITARLDAELDS